MGDGDITWLLLIIICILLIICSLLYLSGNNRKSGFTQYATELRNSIYSLLGNDSKEIDKTELSVKEDVPPRGEDKELFNDILNEKQSDVTSLSSFQVDEEVPSSEESEDENQNSVIDYETYHRVCEDYRKTTLALKERESEVASLMKEIETKTLTIKMLNDKLLSFGSTMEKEENLNSKEVIKQQKQIIETLLSVDGNAGNIDKLLSMYEAKVRELADAKQIIEKMKQDYAQFETLQKKGELVDKLMIENEALRARIRMEIPIPYSFTPLSSYPPLPPGFGYSQNASVADENSIGVLEEMPDLHMNPGNVDVLSTSSQSSLQKVRTLKLKNKVYFQLVEASNSIQKAASKKGGTITKLSSSSITKIARYVRDCESIPDLKKKMMEIMPCIHLCTDSEFSDYVTQLRLALSKQ